MADKKKILIVIHQLNIGGAQKALISALNAIDYQLNDVTLYVRKKRLDLLPQVNKKVSRIIINDDETNYYHKPYAIYLLLRQWLNKLVGKEDKIYRDKLRNFIIDSQLKYEKERFFSDGVVYDVAISYIQGYHAILVAKYISAKRKVLFYHASTDEEHKIHESIMGDFSEIFCVSLKAQQEVRRFYPQYSDKIHCLENIVNVQIIKEKADERPINRKGGQVVLCSCGRLAAVKGFDLAVEAAHMLEQKGLDFLWYFVGDGPERGKLEQSIASYGLQDRIVMSGMQENPYPYIKNCDIYVQPSYDEAQGLSIIEAQVLCRPVVSTNTAGGKSLIKDGENGVLTSIDASSLVEGIEKLANDLKMKKKIEISLKLIDYSEKEKDFKEKWARMLGRSI